MSQAYEDYFEFLVARISLAELATFKPSPETRARAWELLRKEKESGLLPEEKTELDEYEQLEHLVRMAKAHARRSSAR